MNAFHPTHIVGFLNRRAFNDSCVHIKHLVCSTARTVGGNVVAGSGGVSEQESE